MNLNDLISESQIEKNKLEERKAYINSLQEKEEYLRTLPYYDEYPRVSYTKHHSCKTRAAKVVLYSSAFAVAFLSYNGTKFKYGIFIS
jgi:hypothetical protein